MEKESELAHGDTGKRRLEQPQDEEPDHALRRDAEILGQRVADVEEAGPDGAEHDDDDAASLVCVQDETSQRSGSLPPRHKAWVTTRDA